MIQLQDYQKIKNAQESRRPIVFSSFVCMANIYSDENRNFESVVVSDNHTNITVVHNGSNISQLIGSYAVCGRELLKITNITYTGNNAVFHVERGQKGTINSFLATHEDNKIKANYSFRCVKVMDNIKEYSASTENTNNGDIFSFQLSKYNVKINDKLASWQITNPNREYKVRFRDTVAYIFEGIDSEYVLKYTCFAEKVYNTKSRNEMETISISFSDKFVKIYNNNLTLREQIKNASPKQFFSKILGTPPDMVVYKNGLNDSNFKKVNNISTKEFPKYKDLLDAYAKHGYRFHYDELERINVFCDYKVDNIQPVVVGVDETNIMDIETNSDSYLVRNAITSTFLKRQTLYDFETFANGKFLDYSYSIDNIPFTLISDGKFNSLEVENVELFRRVQYQDYVLLKDRATGVEFHGYVLQLTKTENSIDVNRVGIALGNYDKDFRLNEFGRIEYLVLQGYNTSRQFDLFYVKNELPNMITHTDSVRNIDWNLKMPLLPQILGRPTQHNRFEYTFGGVENLTGAENTGICEEIDGIYGKWDSSKLLYNRGKEQFSNTAYPNIFVLSNTITTPAGNSNNSIERYNTYDNRNLEITIEKSKSSEKDIVVWYKNTKQISAQDLFISQPISRVGESTILFRVDSLEGYNVGDVLIINPLEDMSTATENTYQAYKNVKWRIVATITSGTQYHIQVDSAYPTFTEGGAVIPFPFTKYPSTSIVYLMEFYIKANPVIQYSQSVRVLNEDSIKEYDEIEYNLDGRFFNEEDFKTTLNYIKRGFSGLDKESLKQIVPLKISRHFEIQKGDVIAFKDDIYTKVEVNQKWYVLSTKINHSTAMIECNLVSLNNFNAVPENIDFADVMEYEPTSDPVYNHTSEEEGLIDDTTPVIEGTDMDLGTISLKEITLDRFSAKVFLKNDDTLQLYDFTGTNQTTFRNVFFPLASTQEFVVQINNENIYVKSFTDGDSDKDSVTILKRNLFNKTQGEQVITTDLAVKFYQIVSGTTTDGHFQSQSIHVGTEDDYMEFTPENKLKIKTSGLISLENTRNFLYFDPSLINNKSRILLDVTDPTNLDYQDVRFQIGDSNGSSYIQYKKNVKDFEITIKSNKLILNNRELTYSINARRVLWAENVGRDVLPIGGSLFIQNKKLYNGIFDFPDQINLIHTFTGFSLKKSNPFFYKSYLFRRYPYDLVEEINLGGRTGLRVYGLDVAGNVYTLYTTNDLSGSVFSYNIYTGMYSVDEHRNNKLLILIYQLYNDPASTYKKILIDEYTGNVLSEEVITQQKFREYPPNTFEDVFSDSKTGDLLVTKIDIRGVYKLTKNSFYSTFEKVYNQSDTAKIIRAAVWVNSGRFIIFYDDRSYDVFLYDSEIGIDKVYTGTTPIEVGRAYTGRFLSTSLGRFYLEYGTLGEGKIFILNSDNIFEEVNNADYYFGRNMGYFSFRGELHYIDASDGRIKAVKSLNVSSS